MAGSSPDGLKVIALISGGKDSFYSALHCSLNGHSLVALANLFPAPDPVGGRDEEDRAPAATRVVRPNDEGTGTTPGHDRDDGDDHEDADLNSFMYQTVGHQLIPLYAAASGLPLYRQPIRGGARDAGRDYDARGAAAAHGDGDETESMVPLLRAVMRDHPEANALCAGAILSTYQRTRVESVALRLGLTPLAYLWKFPVLPPPGPGLPRDDAQLLLDMAAAGLDARVVKVASAGLDEDFLWERVSSSRGVARVKKALRRFGAAEGSVLGEGGEFETMVVDGPASLFRKRIVVPDGRTRVVREGGGTSWLSIREAGLEDKVDGGESEEAAIRVPELLDPRFQAVAATVAAAAADASDAPGAGKNRESGESPGTSNIRDLRLPAGTNSGLELHWTVSSENPAQDSIEEETRSLVEEIQRLLDDPSHPSPLPTTAITNTIIILRRMADFPAINGIYARLFEHPNPPSRVTISCGDLLPEGTNIAIHLTVRCGLEPGDRKGLHVQSRSYWAPANIGPYSQAIDVPLAGVAGSGGGGDEPAPSPGVRLISIAGQIPLWPATMVIPPDADVMQQITLSLQHLWRIGVDQKVQVWSSAVAYFPRAASAAEMRRLSVVAGRAWETAHMFGTGDEDEDEDDEAGPDVWDRRYNSAFMTFGGAGDGAQPEGRLPDWDVFKGSGDGPDDAGRAVPPFFAAEVEELPRQSGVEWHAHAGLANLGDASVEVVECAVSPSPADPASGEALASHTVVAGVPVRSVVALEVTEGRHPSGQSPGELAEALARAYAMSLGGPADQAATPCLIYVQAASGATPAAIRPGSAGGRNSATAVIACRSLWSSRGRPVAAVGVFSATSR